MPMLGVKPSRFDPHLLLTWAPLMKKLDIGDWAFEVPGLREFVAAAVSVSEIDISTSRASDSALADEVLCASKSVRVVRCGDHPDFDKYVHSDLPQQLQHLEVSFAVLRRQPRAKRQRHLEALLAQNVKHASIAHAEHALCLPGPE